MPLENTVGLLGEKTRRFSGLQKKTGKFYKLGKFILLLTPYTRKSTAVSLQALAKREHRISPFLSFLEIKNDEGRQNVSGMYFAPSVNITSPNRSATCVPPPAAVANAICNAVGVRIRRLPLSPENVLRTIRDQKEAR